MRFTRIGEAIARVKILPVIGILILWNKNVVGSQTFPTLTEDKRSIKEINITIFQILIKNTKPGPLDEDLKETKLYRIIGNLFNPNYHSVKKPKDLVNIYTEQLTEDALEKSMPDNLADNHFSLKGIHSKLKLHTNARRYFQLYLQNLAYCPLQYKWRDLGESVWPRYFKETSCVKKTCSYPPGMQCGASVDDMKQVALLYWNCHARVKKSGASRCGWSIFKITVISKCKCMCGKS